MALALMILACFSFYGTSRYFPHQEFPGLLERKQLLFILASVMSISSLFLFTRNFDGVTGFFVWLVAFMTILSAVIPTVKMNIKWSWAWGAICVGAMIVDFL
ncbi:MAG: hypothetical protein AAFR61_12740 [Bacteroidota bacterium]